MNNYHKIDGTITHILNFITLVLILISTICVIAQIIFRYVIQFSALWTEALARYTMILFTFFGSALAVKSDSHIKLTIVINRIKNRVVKNCLFIFFRLIEFSYLSLLLVSLTEVNKITGRFMASSLSIPMSAMYIGIMIGIIFMLYEIIVVINKRLKKQLIKEGKTHNA